MDLAYPLFTFNSDLLGPPGPSPWFTDHVELEPFDLPPGVGISFNSEGFMEIKNDSSTVLYMAGAPFWGMQKISDEAPVDLPPGKILLHKAVDGRAYEWRDHYDDVNQLEYSAWSLDDNDSIWLFAFGNQIRTYNGSIVELAPVNQFDGNRPENVKIPEPQKVFLPIIYENKIIEIPIIVSYTLNTNYRSNDSQIKYSFVDYILIAFYFAPVIIVVVGLFFALFLFLRWANKRSNNASIP